MRVHTLLQYRWSVSGYVLIHEEGFDYCGPVAECKGDKVAQESEKAQAKFNNVMADITQKQFADSQAALTFMRGRLQPMIDNPKGMSDSALVASRTSATDFNSAQYQNAVKAMQNNAAIKSGDLPSGVNAQIAGSLASEEAATQAGTQNQITAQNEQLKQTNYWNAMNALNGVAAQSTGAMTGMAGNVVGGARSVADLSQANTAASGPGFGAILGSVAGGAAQGLMCPVEGSLYLMADDTERPVETLAVGDQIMGIDGEPQTIDEIQTAWLDALEVHTDDGFVTRNSNVHAFALPHGGFVVALRSLGKYLKTTTGTGKVVDLIPIGKKKVFSVITDGSHTYRADGVWALGASEGERTIPAEVWDRVGRQIARKVQLDRELVTA